MSSISPEQQSDWANELLESLEDSVTSNSFVTNWLKSNLGLLNTYLSSDFQISESGHITPEFNAIQSGIYNELFICAWLRKKARITLGAMEYDWIEMEGEDQGRIKRVPHTQKAAAYQSMSKDCDIRLKDIIKTYKGGDFAAPRQITFNDRRSSPTNIYCSCFHWSDSNPINQYV
jgi:hypothetical protein